MRTSLNLFACVGFAVTVIVGSTLASELCHLASPFLVQPIPVIPDYAGAQMSAPFDVDVEFDSEPYRCACCEYRQSLRIQIGGGGFVRDGTPFPYSLVNPVTLAPTDTLGDTFHEDFPNYPTGNVRYGHRAEPQSANESYTNGGSGPLAGGANRANGCHYHAHDAPGIINLKPGHNYEVSLVFRGEIVCGTAAGCGDNPIAPVTSKEWNVNLMR